MQANTIAEPRGDHRFIYVRFSGTGYNVHGTFLNLVLPLSVQLFLFCTRNLFDLSLYLLRVSLYVFLLFGFYKIIMKAEFKNTKNLKIMNNDLASHLYFTMDLATSSLVTGWVINK